MTINCTVFLQIFHFWVAYFLLRYLIFQPILQILNQDQTRHQNIAQAISDLEETIATAKRKRQKIWEQLHSFVLQKKSIMNEFDTATEPSVIIPQQVTKQPEKTTAVIAKEIEILLARSLRL